MKRPDSAKIKALQELAGSLTRKQLRSVLGIMNFEMAYKPRFAEVAKPLTDLMSSKMPNILPWSEVDQSAFNTLKGELCKATAQYIPVHGGMFVLRSDASQFAVAARLSQMADYCFPAKVERVNAQSHTAAKNSTVHNRHRVRKRKKPMLPYSLCVNYII